MSDFIGKIVVGQVRPSWEVSEEYAQRRIKTSRALGEFVSDVIREHGTSITAGMIVGFYDAKMNNSSTEDALYKAGATTAATEALTSVFNWMKRNL